MTRKGQMLSNWQTSERIGTVLLLPNSKDSNRIGKATGTLKDTAING
jgi:hypothetical protein